MINKQRLSASVDAALLEAAEAAVARGGAPTLSAWVNDALRLKLVHDRRLLALAAFLGAYEDEHGAFSAEELAAVARRARQRSVPTRARVPVPTHRRAPVRAPKRRRGAQ